MRSKLFNRFLKLSAFFLCSVLFTYLMLDIWYKYTNQMTSTGIRFSDPGTEGYKCSIILIRDQFHFTFKLPNIIMLFRTFLLESYNITSFLCPYLKFWWFLCKVFGSCFILQHLRCYFYTQFKLQVLNYCNDTRCTLQIILNNVIPK